MEKSKGLFTNVIENAFKRVELFLYYQVPHLLPKIIYKDQLYNVMPLYSLNF